MGRRSCGKRVAGPWYGDERRRLLYEYAARRTVPRLKARTLTSGSRAGRAYTVVLDVPYYEPRRVEVLFPKAAPHSPRVKADGPTRSKHRYGRDRLCMWDPNGPIAERWLFEDGLTALLGLTAAHLFREAWWRETGEWLGPEVEHPSLPAEPGD